MNTTSLPTTTNAQIDRAAKRLVVIEATKKEVLRGLSMLLLIVFVFLFLRFFLRLLGSDPLSLFAGFVFLISGFFLLPFINIFPSSDETITAGEHVVDVQALIALFCYFILVTLIMAITFIVSTMLKTRKQVSETVQRDNVVDPQQVDEVVK